MAFFFFLDSDLKSGCPDCTKNVEGRSFKKSEGKWGKWKFPNAYTNQSNVKSKKKLWQQKKNQQLEAQTL